MINHALEIASAAAVLIVVLLIWLIRERFKLKKELQLLKDNVSRNNQDIVDLISTAITVDERLADYGTLLTGVQAKVADFKQVDATAQPYHVAIQKVKAGAGVAEVMQNFGLSKEEATLLIRLHGHKSNFD
ncbi:MAG: DUF2802 domain-containing protein [Methylococcales bacterium]